MKNPEKNPVKNQVKNTMNKHKYVLVSPARNEADYIEKTIKSVLSQSELPRKFIIVSDGSTDGTDDIIMKYQEENEFILLLRADGEKNRNFGSKVNAFNAGYAKLNDLDYDYIGCLDADVSFDKEYYKNIFERFDLNSELGLAGGWIWDIDGETFRESVNSPDSVPGAVQMFRRKCFEDIGGYFPLKKGGIDAYATVRARMSGWETRSFTELKVYHHRPMGTGKGSLLDSRFRQGIMEYSHGNHPLFELAKCILRIKEYPHLIGSAFRMTGYLFSMLRRDVPDFPDNVVKFLQNEQINKLKKLVAGKTFK